MTTEQIKGYAYQAMNLFRQQIRSGGKVNPVIAVVFDTEFHRMKMLESEWAWTLDNGHTRRRFFAIMRAMVEARKPDAVIFATASDCYVRTPKGIDLSSEEFNRMVENEYERLKSEGYITPLDSITALVQTEEIVGQIAELSPSGKIALQTKAAKQERETVRSICGFKAIPQSDFRGNAKMYGESYDWPDGLLDKLNEAAGALLKERSRSMQ